ncbi:hypothetical protein [Mesorhizobium sp. dw_380]|uniref:DUF6894 family protein n=1 Tax=Mesorhizobium sp. dw_380 TaxID=2812001 RepID=UPI001BDF3035|nr:hypothetical protein [Mesorhizobium sp. dw_380]
MARFFFDLTDNGEFYPDTEGTDLPTLEDVEDEAAMALLEIAMPDGTFREVAIRVRDHTSKPLFTVKVTLERVREPSDE